MILQDNPRVATRPGLDYGSEHGLPELVVPMFLLTAMARADIVRVDFVSDDTRTFVCGIATSFYMH